MLATQIGRTWWPSKWGCLIVAARLLLFYRWYLIVAIRSRLIVTTWIGFELLERLRLAEAPWSAYRDSAHAHFCSICPIDHQHSKRFKFAFTSEFAFAARFSIHLNIHLDIRLFWIILNRCPIELQTSSATSCNFFEGVRWANRIQFAISESPTIKIG